MSKQILIDSYFGLVRTAIAEGSSLLDYYEESPDQGRSKGNIYRGVVKKVDAPIQAAFVRFGGGRDGFLPMRDAGSGNKAPKVGDAVLVQVVKDEVGEKGAALTTKLSLSGRYLVFIPERDSEGGISSKITDEERAALKKILGELQIPDGGSVILRTAAMNKGIGELQADLDRLTESYREITDRFAKGKEAALLFREVPPALRYLREYYAPDVERIWVNQEEVLDQCRQFFYLYEPKSAAKVALSKDGPLMFQKLGLEADVERLNSRKVALPSGANIIIDQAEALVAIDVNSAKAGGRGEEGRKHAEGKGGSESGRSNRKRGNDLEETVFAVNKEAATEIARQLRLRDLGGIIIVDFIDMEEEKHRRQIEETMRRALANDKAKVKIYDISPLGIMQISRQRLRKAGPNFSRQTCEPCLGRGWHPSPAAGALTVLRKMEERLHGKKAGQSLMVSAPYPIANKLINEFREHVFSMEKRFGCTLRVTAMPTASGDSTIVSQGPGGEDRSREPAPAVARGRVDNRSADAQEGRDAQRNRDGRDGLTGRGDGDGARGGRGDRGGRGGQGGQGGQGEGGGRNRRGEPRTGQGPQETESAGSPERIPGQDRLPVNADLDAVTPYTDRDAGAGLQGLPQEGGADGIHPELIRAFDELPSHIPPTLRAPHPHSAERIPASAGMSQASDLEPAQERMGDRGDSAIGESVTENPAEGDNVPRPRGRSRSSRGRGRGRGAGAANAAASATEAIPMRDRPQAGKGEPGSDTTEKPSSQKDGRQPQTGGRRPAPRAAVPRAAVPSAAVASAPQSAKPQRARGADGRGKSADIKGRADAPAGKASTVPVKAVEARIKTGAAVIPAANGREPAGPVRSEDADAPRRRSRRRGRLGRRGKGGSKDGAAA
jgi:Rne/Rng family ribonuclease